MEPDAWGGSHWWAHYCLGLDCHCRMLVSSRYTDILCSVPSSPVLAATRSKDGREKVRRRVPKGTSDYQATWILDSGSEKVGSL